MELFSNPAWKVVVQLSPLLMEIQVAYPATSASEKIVLHHYLMQKPQQIQVIR